MAIVSTQQNSITTAPQGGDYRTPLFILGILYFMMGFITCLNDTLVPFFKTGFDLSYAQSSLVQVYFFITYAIMSIPAGFIVEKIGYQKGMVAGFTIAGLGAFLFFPAALLHQYELFLGALFVLAIGIVLLQVAANPYITLLGRPETASSRLALIQGIGSVGTTVAPLFGAYFILNKVKASGSSGDAVSTPYLFIGLVLLVIALFVLFLKLPKVAPAVEGPTTRDSIFSHRHFRLGVIGIFMYVGAEVAIGTFLTNYIADVLQVPEQAANRYVSFYWGGMLIGRLLGSAFLKIVKPQLVLTYAAIAAMLFIIISVFSTGYLAVWSMIAVGLCNAVMFAIIFSLALKGMGNNTTRASGLLSTAIVGGAVIPYLKGLLIDGVSWQWAFALPFLCYLYICFYATNGYKPLKS